MLLRRASKGYVLGVTSSHHFWSWRTKLAVAGTGAEIAERLDPADWQRLSAGSGTKGERMYDWAYLALADITAAEFGSDIAGVWTRGLLIRGSIVDASLAFFTTCCPVGTGIETLVKVEGTRPRDRGGVRDRRRTSSGLIIMRREAGTAGTGTSRSPCSLSPCSRR